MYTFQYYGGVPRRVIFDNARVAVKSGFGAHAAAQDDYKQLAAHYGFEPVFCNPASPLLPTMPMSCDRVNPMRISAICCWICLWQKPLHGRKTRTAAA